MARKLKLMTVPLNPSGNGAAEEAFDYGAMLKQIIGYAPPNRGMVFSEIEAALAACAPITEAMEAGAEEVTLTEGQWQLLREKFDGFPWRGPHPVILEFGRMIRDAPEIT